MAREGAPGLSLGQLVTLTLGFLVASVLIFAFGWWVGYDVAQRRLALEQQVVRLPAALPTIPGPATPSPTLLPTVVELLPTVTATAIAQSASPTATVAVSTATAAPTPTRSAIRLPGAETPISLPTAASQEVPVRGWTVQAAATTDPVQAVVLARRLREKGYDAYTATTQIRDVMWYRVRVGRFRDRTEAKVAEIKLKEEEGLEAAFVTPQ